MLTLPYTTLQRIEVLEKLLGKWGKVLHPRNLLLVRWVTLGHSGSPGSPGHIAHNSQKGETDPVSRLRYNLVGLYGRQPGYSQEEMTEALWERKRELCEDVMVTLKVGWWCWRW